MPINNRPIIINDGGSSKKKVQGPVKPPSNVDWDSILNKGSSTQGPKQPVQGVDWGKVNQALQQGSGQKLQQSVQDKLVLPTWKSLNRKPAVYPQQPQKIDLSTFQSFNPSASKLNSIYLRNRVNAKSVSDAEDDLRKRQKELDALSLGNNQELYNQKLQEYNRAYEKYENAVETANLSAKNYEVALQSYDGRNLDSLKGSVKTDYSAVEKANEKARQDAVKTTRNELESRKKAIELEISERQRMQMQYGINTPEYLQNDYQIRQLQKQISALDSEISSIGNWEEAYDMEAQAQSDPRFDEYVRKGQSLIEENRRTINRAGGDLSWYQDYEAMTDEQKKVYAYYLGKTGKESDSVNYKDKIQSEINKKINDEYTKRIQELSSQNPLGYGIASVFTQPIAAAQTAADMLSNLANPDKYNQVADPNTRGNRLQRGSQLARQAGLEQIENPVARALAETGYAIADMAPALAANAVAPGLGTAYMGILGGTSGYTNAADRGLTNAQALQYGAVSGAVSTALEKIGLDKIGEAFAGGKKPATQILRNVLGSFLSEGSEEAAENVAQVIYDEIISGTKSAKNQAVQQYMSQGMSQAEAEKRAWMDIGEDTLSSFIVGGLAGGVMSGAGSLMQGVASTNQNTTVQNTPQVSYSLGESTPNRGNYDAISKLAEEIGTTTVLDESLGPGVNGYYDTRTGEIHISPDANVETVFSHELTHSLEGTDAYQKLRDLVINNLGDEVETLRRQKADLYQSQGVELDVDAELVADYVSQNLFTDAEAIRSLAQQDRSLATRIKNWISRMVAKVTGQGEKAFLMRAEDLYAQALQQNRMRTMSTEAETQAARYSVSNEERLQKENEELKRQMTRTTEAVPTPTRVNSTAQQLLKGYGSRYDKGSLVNDLNSLYKLMGNPSTTDQNGVVIERTDEAIRSQAMQIAAKILDQSETVNSSTEQDYKNILEILRNTPVDIPMSVRANISGGYADFIRRHRKELNVSVEGSNIEELWSVLEEEYPAIFDSSLFSNPSDMMNQIGDVLDDLKPGATNPYTNGALNYREEQERLADEIVERFFSIPQRSPTFADRQAVKLTKERIKARKRLDAQAERNKAREKRIREESRVKQLRLKEQAASKVQQVKEQERAKSNKKVAELKEKHGMELKKVRSDRDRKISELKSSQRQKEAEERDRRTRRETREKITRHVKDLSNKVLHPTDKSHIPDALTQPVATLLEAVNLESNFSRMQLPGGKTARVNATMGEPTKRTQAFREMREAFSQIAKDPRWSNRMTIDPDLEANIDEVISMKNIRIMDMTQEQLNTVWNTIRSVEHAISTENQLFSESRYQSVANLANSLRKSLDSLKASAERKGVVGQIVRLLNVEMLNPYDYFHEMGKGGDELYHLLRSSQDRYIRNLQTVQNFMSDFDPKEIRKLMNGKSEEFTVSGGKIKLNTAQIMYLYSSMKRPQAKQHILAGGIKQGEIQGKRGKVEKSDRPVTVTEEDVRKITNRLSNSQKRMADSLCQFMSTVESEMGNEASMKLYGYQKFTEPYYIPIVTDPNYVSRDFADSTGQGSIKNKGFTKQLSENATNPVIINDIFSVFAKHSVEMSAYNAYLPVLEDMQKIYNFKPYGEGYQGSVSESIERVLGKDGQKYFTNFIQDINGTANLRNDFDVGSLLSNYKRAAVGANLRVIIQQPTSYFRAAAVLNPKYLTKAVFTPKKWEQVKRYSPIAQWKDWGYFEVNTGRQLEDIILGTDSKFEKVQQGLMAAAGKADEITWTRLWSACEYWVRDHRKDLERGSEAYYQEVNNKFNEVVDRTQVVDSVFHRSQIMRSKSGLNKMATSFMGEPTKSYNLLRTSVRDFVKAPKGERAGAAKKMVGGMSAFLVSSTINAAAAALIDALRDDDEDETYLEKWGQAFSGIQGDEENWEEKLSNLLLSSNLADNLNILNMIPYVKDVMSMIQGFTVDRMDMSAISDFLVAARRFTKSLEGEGTYTLTKNLVDMVTQFAKIAGVPAVNLLRDMGSITQTVIRSIDDPVITYYYDQISAPVEKNKGMYYDLLFESLVDGKEDAYKTIRDSLLESHGISLGDIRTAMRERFKEAWENDPSLENNSLLMMEAGVSMDTIAEWKINAFKAKWKEDPSIADNAEAMKQAGVTADNIAAWEEEEWKEYGYLKELKALGVETSVVEQLSNAIKNASKSSEKRAIIRNSSLTNTQKSVLYRWIVEEGDRELIDTYRENGWDVGELYRLLDGMAESSTSRDKLNVLMNSTLSQDQLVQLMNEKIFEAGSKRPDQLELMLGAGLTVNDYITIYDKWYTLDNSEMKADEKATEFAMWLDDAGYDPQQQILVEDSFGFYSFNRGQAVKYDKLKNSGLSPEDASKIQDMLAELTPEEGEDGITAEQQYKAIAQSDLPEETKMKALSALMDEKTYAKFEGAYEEGISLSTYIQYWADKKKISSDKDENGESIDGSKKEKLLTFIDSLDLTTEQKDYLYFENGYSDKTLEEAPWYGGPSYDGPLFDDEASGVDGENVWAAASEVVEDQTSKITQRFSSEHGGTDIGYSISPTEPIYAAGDGTVVWVQTGYGNAPNSTGNASYGNLVKIQHADGSYTLYAHLSAVDVKEGDVVSAGQQIGNMGDSGNAYGSHLHFEYRDANDNRLDSTAFLEGDFEKASGGEIKGSTGGSSNGSSGGSSKKNSGSSSKKTTITGGGLSLGGGSSWSPPTAGTMTSRRTPTASSMTLPTATITAPKRVTTSSARRLSMPTVKPITRTSTSGMTLPSIGGGITRRVSGSTTPNLIKI